LPWFKLGIQLIWTTNHTRNTRSKPGRTFPEENSKVAAPNQLKNGCFFVVFAGPWSCKRGLGFVFFFFLDLCLTERARERKESYQREREGHVR